MSLIGENPHGLIGVPPSRENAVPREPLYTRIIADIKAKITAGELSPGDQLPSMSQLQAQYGVSVTAVRNAMLVLRSEGIVEGHQGKGVYVTGPVEGE
ncbi:winged helix-turn-helix domain-containing protein [Micromonospora sp. DT227]|uniref:winged helix-turn-helix domain-containing protein n=1 Tax=Micromonospora sp. DT227 TaxID=3393433 RepID=UPI003CF9F54F